MNTRMAWCGAIIVTGIFFWVGRPSMARGQQAEHDHGEIEETHDDGPEVHLGEEPVVKLKQVTLDEFQIEVVPASAGEIDRVVSLPGEVVFNANQIAHVTPTVSGIVQEVNYSVGDRVEAGAVMAVLNSREVAAARSEYLAAQAMLELARENLERDERLFQEKVGTERAMLAARQAFQEARIDLNQAENALHAIGFTHDQIEAIGQMDESKFNTYMLRAPLSGVVTDRHLTVGEVIEPSGDGAPFVVADLSTVWVDITVYQRDLELVSAGKRVTLSFGHGIPDAQGEISFLSPSLDEETRTATARVVLPNPRGHWRPGLFLNATVAVEKVHGRVVVSASAIQTVEGDPIVFVRVPEGFTPRRVELGNRSGTRVEVVEGLVAGEHYAATNTFVLKSELNRTVMEHAGHAH